MKDNMRFVTKGFSGFNLLGVDTHIGTCKGHSGAWLIVMLLVILMAGCNGNVSLENVPTVILTSPAADATGVATNTQISAAFSEEMESSTINDTTFTLQQGATPVKGTVVLADDGVTAVFTLVNDQDANTTAIDLAANTTYTATITTGARNKFGNALASDFVWSFTTVAAGVLNVSPSTLTYANQTVGTTSAIQTVTISNTSGTALNVTSIAPGLPNPGDFVLTLPSSLTIDAGATQTFMVAFKPTALGTRSTTINITYNGGTASVFASGKGI